MLEIIARIYKHNNDDCIVVMALATFSHKPSERIFVALPSDFCLPLPWVPFVLSVGHGNHRFHFHKFLKPSFHGRWHIIIEKLPAKLNFVGD